MTTDYNKTDRLSPTTRKLTGHNSRKTQECFRSDRHTHQYTHCQHNFHKHHTEGKMHSNCRLLPEDIVCKITQKNTIRRANTCDPALKLLNEEIISTEHLDAHWDHRHNTRILWKNIHGLSNRASPTTLNNSITFNNKITHIQTYCELFHQTVHKHATHKTTDPLTGQHKTYKDTRLHSPLLRSKKQ